MIIVMEPLFPLRIQPITLTAIQIKLLFSKTQCFVMSVLQEKIGLSG